MASSASSPFICYRGDPLRNGDREPRPRERDGTLPSGRPAWQGGVAYIGTAAPLPAPHLRTRMARGERAPRRVPRPDSVPPQPTNRGAGDTRSETERRGCPLPPSAARGGFSQQSIAILLGVFGAMLIVGMVIWTFILPRMQRPVAMRIALTGFLAVTVLLAVTNRLGENPQTLSDRARRPLLVLPAIGVCVSSRADSRPPHSPSLPRSPRTRQRIAGRSWGCTRSCSAGGNSSAPGRWHFRGHRGLQWADRLQLFLTAVAFWSVQVSSEHLRDRLRRRSGSFKRVPGRRAQKAGS